LRTQWIAADNDVQLSLPFLAPYASLASKIMSAQVPQVKNKGIVEGVRAVHTRSAISPISRFSTGNDQGMDPVKVFFCPCGNRLLEGSCSTCGCVQEIQLVKPS
jgi:hypothetical protein